MWAIIQSDAKEKAVMIWGSNHPCDSIIPIIIEYYPETAQPGGTVQFKNVRGVPAKWIPDFKAALGWLLCESKPVETEEE